MQLAPGSAGAEREGMEDSADEGPGSASRVGPGEGRGVLICAPSLGNLNFKSASGRVAQTVWRKPSRAYVHTPNPSSLAREASLP
eukprot:scaffold781_cov394-Prasinococcus_capsulatus_cf.AAC.2